MKPVNPSLKKKTPRIITNLLYVNHIFSPKGEEKRVEMPQVMNIATWVVPKF